MAEWTDYLASHRDQFLTELLDFLRIPSISSLPEHAEDIQQAAKWVASRMKKAGIEEVQIMPTDGHPVVYGEWLHAPDKPTIMIYGHFDTQPVDPLDKWETPPFKPVIRNGRVYARGASDDKGNMLIPILAIEALLASEGVLPVNVKCFFEGQEEIGSPDIPLLVEEHKDAFACDLVISADGLQWREDQPAIFLGFKGMCALQVDVKGPGHDLHSGIYGGAVQNPLHALVHLLDSMHDGDGRVLVEGFYDTVKPLSDSDRRQISAVPFDESEYKEALGISDIFGEVGYNTHERAWARPTLEINGVWGGFQEEGVKAVIPSEAHGKITCRLVADQDPADILALLETHIKRHTPTGVAIATQRLSSFAYPYLMPSDYLGNQAVHEVLETLYGKAPYYVRLGGTLPICSHFRDILGAYTIMFGFCLEDERIHAPNEYFRLSSFDRGQKAYVMLLHKLGEYDTL